MPSDAARSFGTLLRLLRKRAGLTQQELVAALSYSDSLISSLETGQRQPDLEAIVTRFIPALGVQDDPAMAQLLVERAAAARGERLPDSLTLASSAGRAGYGAAGARPDPLPQPPDELLGRDPQVQQIGDRLLGHHGRLLTLIGPPGIGKTRLALAIAARIQHCFPDGAVFVPLAAVHDAAAMTFAITAAVRGEDTGQRSPAARLVAALRRRQLLLVLDNCEQVVGAGPLVAELLASCPGLWVLATSRERLHLRAEQRYRVPALDLQAAVELFRRRACAVDADIALTEGDRHTVEAICRRLDYLPLAIELCAAQLDLLTPVQILAHLRAHPLDLLVDGARDLPSQQRTLRHAIQRSYDLLTEVERAALRSLSVFVGGWSWEQMEAVSGSELESEPGRLRLTLHALVGKSLVHVEMSSGGEQRLVMLETIREFAGEQAAALGEAAPLRERHFTAYLDFFRLADSHLRGPEGAAWFARAKLERDNVRAAMRWALDEGRSAEAAWLVLAVGWFWLLCGQNEEIAGWIRRLLPGRERLAPELRLALLLWLYAFATELEEFQPLAQYTGEILELLKGCPYQNLHAGAWHWIATTSQGEAQLAASERAVALAREAQVMPGPAAFGLLADGGFLLAANLENHAARLIEHGAYEQAASYAAESLALYRAQGHQEGVADCLSTLGRLAFLQGELERAQRLLHEAIQLQAYTAQASLLEWQVLLGRVTLYSGDAREARRLLTESLSQGRERHRSVLCSRACTYLAETALAEGELADAGRWLAESLTHAATSPLRTRDHLDQVLAAARVATAQGDYLGAATLFGLSDQMSHRMQHRRMEPASLIIATAQETVRAALDPEAFAEAFASGHRLVLDEAGVDLSAVVQRILLARPDK